MSMLPHAHNVHYISALIIFLWLHTHCAVSFSMFYSFVSCFVYPGFPHQCLTAQLWGL